jgi:hypothetical protein
MTQNTPALATAEPSPEDVHQRQRTLLARSAAAKDVAEYAMALVPTIGEDGLAPELDVTLARRLRALAQRYTFTAVLNARARGASWAAIGEQLGVTEEVARGMFAEAEAQWLAGDPAPWAPRLHGRAGAIITGVPPVDVDDVRKAARELDRWCRRHVEGRRDRIFGSAGMVTDGLPTAG